MATTAPVVVSGTGSLKQNQAPLDLLMQQQQKAMEQAFNQRRVETQMQEMDQQSEFLRERVRGATDDHGPQTPPSSSASSSRCRCGSRRGRRDGRRRARGRAAGAEGRERGDAAALGALEERGRWPKPPRPRPRG